MGGFAYHHSILELHIVFDHAVFKDVAARSYYGCVVGGVQLLLLLEALGVEEFFIV